MKTTKFVALAVLLISAGAFLGAQAQEHPGKSEHPNSSEHPTQAGDLIAVASGAGEFTTFVTAIEVSGLVEKFHGEGPFTVFAPTDDAFAKLPAGTLEDLLEPANKAELVDLLANHVVPGIIMAADMKTMKAANVNGGDLSIQVDDGLITVNNARVVQTDLVATNGVIYAIDSVIVPAPAGEHPASGEAKDHPAH